jgi:predicted phage baseplate assembly protein
VGTGSGEPDQIYQLAHTPVLPTTLVIVTQDSGSLTATSQWAQTDDLLSAGPQDRVYSLDPEAGQIRFGSLGMVPAAGSLIIASYQYGGGRQGNVGIGAISSSRDPRLQGGFSLENPVPTSGGDMGQAVSQAEREIPSFIRHKDRLVTAQDFADVTMQTPGVDINRVDVLPLFQPAIAPSTSSTDGVPGVVTLMVLPQTDPVNPLWPMPDRLFLGRICNYLDTRRLVTTEIYVRGAEYVPVYVSVGIVVQSGFFPDLVRNAVSDGLRSYLSSLRGLGPTGAGWPLRKRLLDKDLEAAVTRIDGVEYVDSLLLGINSANPVPYGDFTGLQLPHLDGLSVVEGTAQPLASTIGTVVQPSQPGVSVVPVPVTKSIC